MDCKNNYMIKKGNILTFNQYGTYGFLSAGQMPDTPLTLLDFGLEKRCDETYDFDNRNRDYTGYLFQYTLSGQGAFEAEGTLYPQTPGTAFFSCIPENSRYHLPSGAHETNWEFIYVPVSYTHLPESSHQDLQLSIPHPNP